MSRTVFLQLIIGALTAMVNLLPGKSKCQDHGVLRKHASQLIEAHWKEPLGRMSWGRAHCHSDLVLASQAEN